MQLFQSNFRLRLCSIAHIGGSCNKLYSSVDKMVKAVFSGRKNGYFQQSGKNGMVRSRNSWQLINRSFPLKKYF